MERTTNQTMQMIMVTVLPILLKMTWFVRIDKACERMQSSGRGGVHAKREGMMKVITAKMDVKGHSFASSKFDWDERHSVSSFSNSTFRMQTRWKKPRLTTRSLFIDYDYRGN